MAKNYIKGSFRNYEFDNGDSKMVMSVFVDDLVKIQNDKGYASVVLAERREADDYGNTHYLYENDYKPKGKASKDKPKSKKGDLKAPKYSEDVSDGDTPF